MSFVEVPVIMYFQIADPTQGDHIVLHEPVSHPGFLSYLKKLHKKSCRSCMSLQCTKKCRLISPMSIVEMIHLFDLNPNLMTPHIPVVLSQTIPSVMIGKHRVKDTIEKYYDAIRQNTKSHDPNRKSHDPNTKFPDPNNQTLWNKIVEHDPASFKNRLTGKKGRFRYNLCGKRCDYSARCTLTPGADLKINQVRLPESFASILLVPERCTSFNKAYLQNLVREKKVGMISKGMRRQLLHVNNFQPIVVVGDIVHRYLRKGDHVICNRQPTLEKSGMMAHQVLFHKENTCAINMMTCSSYGADFDGDEINIHACQTVEALTELKLLMDVYQNMEKCTPIQDQVLYSYLRKEEIERGQNQKEEEHGHKEEEQDQKEKEQLITNWLSNEGLQDLEIEQFMANCFLERQGITVGMDDVRQLHDDQGFLHTMVQAKSKGKPTNLEHIMTKYDPGLNPSSFFDHMVEGRAALVDSSIMTAQTGYLQRCLVKNMEDIKMTWQGVHAPISGHNAYITFAPHDHHYVPGDAVGIRIAQAIGEISTQLSLDSFHRVGNEMDELGSFPKLKAILMGKKQEFANQYGIEACVLLCMSELKEILELPEYELTVLLDWITLGGRMDSMNYTMLEKRSSSILTKASFERSTKYLYDAAIHEKTDPCTSVSSQVIIGSLVNIGTGIQCIKPMP